MPHYMTNYLFTNSSPLDLVKKEHNSFAYRIIIFFHALIPFGGNFLGSGKSLGKARSERREREIVNILFDINLKISDSNLKNSSNQEIVLHKNIENGYEIIRENDKIVLYLIKESKFFTNNDYTRDAKNRTGLLTVKDFTSLIECEQIKNNSIYKELETNYNEVKKNLETTMNDFTNKYNYINNILDLSEKTDFVNKAIKKFEKYKIQVNDTHQYTINSLMLSNMNDLEKKHRALISNITEECYNLFNNVWNSIHNNNQEADHKAFFDAMEIF